MALQNEKVDFAVDTTVLRNKGKEYIEIGNEINTISNELVKNLELLVESGWTTPAGKAFEEMINLDWKTNTNKFIDLLGLLNKSLVEAADAYDDFINYYVESTLIK